MAENKHPFRSRVYSINLVGLQQSKKHILQKPKCQLKCQHQILILGIFFVFLNKVCYLWSDVQAKVFEWELVQKKDLIAQRYAQTVQKNSTSLYLSLISTVSDIVGLNWKLWPALSSVAHLIQRKFGIM